MFLCRRSGKGQASEKTMCYSNSEREERKVFKNIQWLLGHVSLKQTRPPVWGIGSGKWREGKVFKEMKRGGDSLGRKDTAAVWTEKSIQTLKDLVQHNSMLIEHLGLSGTGQFWQVTP